MDQKIIPKWFGPFAEYISGIRRRRTWYGAVCACSILSVLIAIGAAIVGGVALGYAMRDTTEIRYVASGMLQCSTFSGFSHYLDGSAAPLAMTFPSDLSGCSSRMVRIWSNTNQPHTVTILPPPSGPDGPSWDGTGKRVATFGGSAGDGMVFEIVQTPSGVSAIRMISTTNVVFT